MFELSESICSGHFYTGPDISRAECYIHAVGQRFSGERGWASCGSGVGGVLNDLIGGVGLCRFII